MLRQCRAGLFAVLILIGLAPISFAAAQEIQLHWAERLHVIYNAETRGVSRVNVRVVDPHPEKNLDFVWQPATGNWPGVDAETRAAEGSGRLVWRVRGSANYDPKTIYSTYIGMVEDGQPGGDGRLELRSGEISEGQWKAGKLHRKGVFRDADGNRYEGEFVAGLPHGNGIYRSRDGSIYEGPFADGKRHGMATVRLPGGTVYRSRWNLGVETGANRPELLADALIGGLLTAQDGGDAGKTEMSVVIDQRITAQQEVQYQHLVRDDDIAIYPVSQQMNDAWNGAGEISKFSGLFDFDWREDFVFVEVEVATTDNSKVKLDTMALEVGSSDVYRKPMFSLTEHIGCTGFRPGFTLRNHGWGAVRNPRMSVQFTSENRPGETSPAYDVPIDTFDEGTDVNLLPAFEAAGVDTARLEAGDYRCPSSEQMAVCRAQLFNSTAFGEITEFVDGEAALGTIASGTLQYEWADDAGNVYESSQPFTANIAIALIQLPENVAECGDGGGLPSAARRYVEIKLPLGKADYAMDIPVRGNSNIRDYTARLKISTEMTSLHRFRASATFKDGSTRYSKPVTLFYYRPRWPEFVSKAEPAACYLPPEYGNTC